MKKTLFKRLLIWALISVLAFPCNSILLAEEGTGMKAMSDEYSAITAAKESIDIVSGKDFAPGEILVQLKEGSDTNDIRALNDLYRVVSVENMLEGIPTLEEEISGIKRELSALEAKDGVGQHERWYWQTNKDSKEYKDYLAWIESRKKTLLKGLEEKQELLGLRREREGDSSRDEDTSGIRNSYIIRADDSVNVAQMAFDYSAHPAVGYAGPNYIVSGQSNAGLSAGLSVPVQWYLEKIQAPQAWRISRGSNKVIIAVIDSGISGRGKEFGGRIIRGFNFVSPKSQVIDDNGHGTSVASIISASPDAEGASGIAPGCRLLAVKVLDAQGKGKESSLAKGIIYAVQHGAKILNLSLTSYAGAALKSAVNYAYDKGCIIVAAAGSDTQPGGIYPAAYDRVVAVTALDKSGRKISSANAARWVDIAAPGEGVLSLGPGTSVAASIVSGVMALVWSNNPKLKRDEVISLVLKSADRIYEAGSSGSLGSGSVNAYKALAAKGLPPRKPSITDDPPFTLNKAQLSCSWNTKLPETGIKYYKYRITEGFPEIDGAKSLTGWKTTSKNKVDVKGLKLETGKKYYFTVQAVGADGKSSDAGYSSSTTVFSQGQASYGMYSEQLLSRDKPTIIFVHGFTGSSENFAQLKRNMFGARSCDYNILNYNYDDSKTLKEISQDFSNWLYAYAKNTTPGQPLSYIDEDKGVLIVVHSYGGIILRQAILDDAIERFKKCNILEIAVPYGGSSCAIASTDFITWFWPAPIPVNNLYLYTFGERYRRILEAMDPEGNIQKSLFSQENVTKARQKAKSAFLIRAENDKHSPPRSYGEYPVWTYIAWLVMPWQHREFVDAYSRVLNNYSGEEKQEFDLGQDAGNSHSDILDHRQMAVFLKNKGIIPPYPPVSFYATDVRHNRLKLAWSYYPDSPQIKGVIIERKGGLSEEFIKVFSTNDKKVDVFEDVGLYPKTQYIYRLCVFNDAGESERRVFVKTRPVSNSPPQIGDIADKIVRSGEILCFNIPATDADGDSITYGMNPAIFGVSLIGNEFCWIPWQEGSYEITFKASDGYAEATEKVSITVTNGYSISGFVRRSNEASLPGVTITVSKNNTAVASVQTDNGGNFKIEKLLPGDYIITPFKPGEEFKPSSSSVTVAGSNITGQVFYANPPVPGNFAAVAGSPTQINLSWSYSSSNERNVVFELRRKKSNESQYTRIASLTPEKRNYQNTGVSPGIAYDYEIRAVAKESLYSAYACASATTPSGIPAAPSNLTAEVQAGNKVKLRWQVNSNNHTSFVLERRLSPNATAVISRTISGNKTDYTDTQVNQGFTYYYRIKAVNSYGSSGFSNQAAASVPSSI